MPHSERVSEWVRKRVQHQWCTFRKLWTLLEVGVLWGAVSYLSFTGGDLRGRHACSFATLGSASQSVYQSVNQSGKGRAGQNHEAGAVDTNSFIVYSSPYERESDVVIMINKGMCEKVRVSEGGALTGEYCSIHCFCCYCCCSRWGIIISGQQKRKKKILGRNFSETPFTKIGGILNIGIHPHEHHEQVQFYLFINSFLYPTILVVYIS